MNKIRPLLWRARAFQGRFLDVGAPEPYVSEVLGEIVLEQRAAIPTHPNHQFLFAVCVAIEFQLKYRQPLDPYAQLRPFMTVDIDKLKSLDPLVADDNARAARVDLITDGRVAYGTVRITDMPCVDLPEVAVDEDDVPWEVFVRLLADVGDSNFVQSGW